MNATLQTAFAIGLTLSAYRLSLAARKRFASPLTSPVFFSTAIVVSTLTCAHVTFRSYGPAKEILTCLLGPATVALAVPVFKNRALFSKHFLAASCGIVTGSVSTMAVAAVLARLFAFPPSLVVSLGLKSVTAPIAIELAKSLHADSALVAVFVVSTGMLGASFGPWLLDRANIRDPVSRGLALGTVSHGQGTAQAASESQLSGAVAGIAMVASAVVTSLVAPGILPLLAR